MILKHKGFVNFFGTLRQASRRCHEVGIESGGIRIVPGPEQTRQHRREGELMTRLKTTKLSLTGAASLLALSFAAGNAYAEEQHFDIEAQPLAKALLEFNEQSGLTVAAPRELVADK